MKVKGKIIFIDRSAWGAVLSVSETSELTVGERVEATHPEGYRYSVEVGEYVGNYFRGKNISGRKLYKAESRHRLPIVK